MRVYNCLNCNKECKEDNYRKKNKYCSNKCQLEFQTKEKIKNWLETGIVNRVGTPSWLKEYILNKQGGRCLHCGIDSWQNRPLVLELEHIDGNSENNLENNLCCLCPNCHSQTSTYKAKNMGNGRKARLK